MELDDFERFNYEEREDEDDFYNFYDSEQEEEDEDAHFSTFVPDVVDEYYRTICNSLSLLGQSDYNNEKLKIDILYGHNLMIAALKKYELTNQNEQAILNIKTLVV